MTSPAQWTAIREQVFKDQKGKCWSCWRTFNSHEDMHAHHAVYTADKNFSKWLDSVENIVLVCPACHSDHGRLSEYHRRLFAWSDKVDLGYNMTAWHDSIPMLIKDHFFYVGKDDKEKRRI